MPLRHLLWYVRVRRLDPGDVVIFVRVMRGEEGRAVSESRVEVSHNGTKRWFNYAMELHRRDGPAVERPDGTREWWERGLLHREGGPAIERSDGAKAWFVKGERHRLDGPAIEGADGSKEWWVNGQMHRLDGPAYEEDDGHREWWVNGLRHRLDGPAVEHSNGREEWWVRGRKLDSEDVEIFVRVLRAKRGL